MKYLNCSQAIFIFYILIFIKLYVFIYIVNFTNMGGGDANYYNDYAHGLVSISFNLWSIFLRFLNELNFYNRDIIRYFLFFLASIMIPIMIASATLQYNRKIFWNEVIIISLYPMLFYWSIDIYRDIPMLFLFLLNIIFLKFVYTKKNINKYLLYIIVFLISIFLYFWRPYLGLSLLFTLFIYKVKINYKILIMLYVTLLLIFYNFDILSPILLYRGENGFEYGNISLGIGLINKTWYEFLYLYLYSLVTQLFGVYFVNLGSIFLFFTETIPYCIGMIYVFKNKSLVDDFERYLLLFSLVYATIWTMGNDNLGTAIRLRMFDYISIFIVVFSLYLKKR